MTEQTALTEVTGRLIEEFPGIAPAEVEEAVRAAHARFDHRPIRDFVPLFVEKHARHQLAHLHIAASA
ncbi:three-helix bundle dimerization domain-containing protein [Mycolicibacterium sp.]|uniref:three-helix bundle dimerization domain-containing protein n=1 Tax=Mycolicibacterium sp. TaxID=2320850 RepID=UPI0037CBA927